MHIHYYIGIDVSKNTAAADRLDWAIYANKRIIWQTQSENSPSAIRAVVKNFRPCPALAWSPAFVAWSIPQRRTVGIYNAHALAVLFELYLPIWLEVSVQIKQAGYSGVSPLPIVLLICTMLAELARSG